MVYRVLNGMAPPYLNQLVPVSSLPGRRRLRSSFTLQLHIPQYRLSTAGRRSFPVAASIFWNTLPDDMQSAPSVSSLRQHLKAFLFHQSFPDILVKISVLRFHGLCNSLGCFSNVKTYGLTLIDISLLHVIKTKTNSQHCCVAVSNRTV